MLEDDSEGIIYITAKKWRVLKDFQALYLQSKKKKKIDKSKLRRSVQGKESFPIANIYWRYHVDAIS